MRLNLRDKTLRAISLVEVILTVTVLTIIVTSGFQVYRLTLLTIEKTQLYTEAEFIARDLIELTISKRNEDWNSLAFGQYHFEEDPVEGFNFVSGPETVDGFTKSVTLSEVQRDGSGNIVDSGGTVDEDVIEVQADVSWSYQSVGFDVQLKHYLTNWRKF